MNACTIIAKNYLAHARVLAESFLEHHPDGTFTTLLLDDFEQEIDEENEPFQIVRVDEIGLAVRELHDMAMIYQVLEFATAVKPWFLRALLDGGKDHVAYFDPDIRIFASLDDVASLARDHSIVLTPHVTSPLPRDGLEPSERTILRAGMFNLGFIAVGEDARGFLDWWTVRLRRDCLVDPGEGQFVDQRWADFVPSLFDHYVLRDPGCNVATWNVDSRDLVCEDGRCLAGGEPLRFYHFSGFDPKYPQLLSRFQGDTPRILLSERPDLAKLCRDYAASLMDKGYADWSSKPYQWDVLADGTRIDRTLRRFYRIALVAAEDGAGSQPPDPFDPADSPAFRGWCGAIRAKPVGAKLTRYARAVYEVDPDALPARAARRIRDWRRARRLDPPRAFRAGPSVPGANVAGYFRAELGIGEVARQIVSAFEQSRVPFGTVTYDRTLSRQEHPFSQDGDGPLYDMNVVCVNADQTLTFRRDMGSSFFGGRYTIGVWFWEIAEFPSFMHYAFSAVDEVWVASDFVREAVSAATSKPVLTVPVPLRMPEPPALQRDHFGLPEEYLFLFSYDLMSVLERKNPLGLLDAFTRAFAPGEGPVLLLKSINGDKKPSDLERVRDAASARPDVIVRDGYLSAEEKDALTAGCDCYVSLHRSEGLGLTMAEAMACGKPVIATAYSGNLNFMTQESSYLVPYSLGRIPPGCDPYPPGVEWAEPDLDEAARLMRHVWENRAEASERGRIGREVIEARSPGLMAAFLERRFAEIRGGPLPKRVRQGRLTTEATFAVAEARRRVGRARRAANGSTAASPPPDMTPLQRAHDLIARGPRNSSSTASRLEPLRDLARRALFRGLRPYTEHQSELDQAIAQALAEQQRILEQQMSELTAVPYMSDPDLLYTGSGASRALGYRAAPDTDSTASYRGFEDVFRGSEEFIRKRQRVYLEVLAGRSPVLDVGCGRGEFLELLAERDIPARGIDIDESMVSRCREKGLDVEAAEAIEHLEAQEDGSIGVVFSAQVIEHLGYRELMRFLELAHAKLAAGGMLIAETVNPHSIQAFKTFWVDLTHRSPIFPEVAVAYCHLSGFAEAQVIFPNGTGDFEGDRRSQGEYAVVAIKG